jgi:hypothetical protein
MDDLELARILRAARDRSAPPPTSTGSRAFMGRVTTTTPAVGKFMNVIPQAVLGTEVEGGSATITDLGSTPSPVYLVGPGVPATGDQVIARWSDWRWVARKRGTGGSGPPTVTMSNCACPSVPGTLALSSTGPCDGVFNACNLIYGPTPSSFSGLNLGANCFLSDQTFTDSLSGLQYRYNFSCDTIFFRLSRVYLATSSSGAFHDSSIYSWSIGQPGNTCAGTPTPTSPFLLSGGYIYPGGNTSCIVTVSG